METNEDNQPRLSKSQTARLIAMNDNIQSVAQVGGKVIVYLRKKDVGPLPQKINDMPIEYKIVGGIAPTMVKYFDQQPKNLREPS